MADFHKIHAKWVFESAWWRAWVELGTARGFWRRLGLWLRFLLN